MADSNLSAMMKQLRLNPGLLKALPGLVSRYGSAGAVALARGYLGPLAPTADAKVDAPRDAPTNEAEAGAASPRKTSSADAALLGLALTKLVYELGELAVF